MNIIIITLFAIVFAARKDCGPQHSLFYNKNHGKLDVTFFVPETYDDTNSCELIENTGFKKLYPTHLRGNDMEYIIDKENSEPELENCNKNIKGNMILANRVWKKDIGNLCWIYVKKEKFNIYGNIFSKAMLHVKQCCGSNSSRAVGNLRITAPTEPPSNPNPTTAPTRLSGINILFILIGIVAVIVLLALFVTCGCLYCRMRNRPVEYNNDS